MFASDGLPRRFTENPSTTPPCDDVGPVGDAGGAIYVSNGNRDYEVVMSPVGSVRVHRWEFYYLDDMRHFLPDRPTFTGQAAIPVALLDFLEQA